MTGDGLDEAAGRVDPDGMSPAFALQHAAVLLEMADEVAAFHAVKQHPGRFLLQGKSTGDVRENNRLNEHRRLLRPARNTLH